MIRIQVSCKVPRNSNSDVERKIHRRHPALRRGTKSKQSSDEVFSRSELKDIRSVHDKLTDADYERIKQDCRRDGVMLLRNVLSQRTKDLGR